MNRAIEHNLATTWRDKALCARAGMNPNDWDSDYPQGHPRRSVIDGLLASINLCADCTVMAQCAADALAEPSCIGVVRACIPLTGSQPPSWKIKALRAIANGFDPLDAIRCYCPDSNVHSVLDDLASTGAPTGASIHIAGVKTPGGHND